MANIHPTRSDVFLVEDSAAIRTRLAAMLGLVEGVAIVGEADAPKSAIEGILRYRPQYVVLDVHLCGGYGIEVLRTIHKVEPTIMFIVLTNHPHPQYRKIFLAAGAQYFLDKHAEFGKVKEITAELAPAH